MQILERILSYSLEERSKIINNMDKRKRKPTDVDILELQVILHDFRIKEDIPEFNSISELDKWRKLKIKEKLNAL